METLSYTTVGLIAAVALFVWIRGFHRWLRQRAAARVRMEEIATGLDLSDPIVRERLTTFLERNRITGSADIRDGKAFAPPSLDRMHPLLGVVNSATAVLSRVKNPASCSLYIRDSVNDRFMLVPELDLEDLREISELLRAAVAERTARNQK